MAILDSSKEGKFWADKLMDLANLSAAVLIFGQLTARQIYWQGVILGLLIYIVIMLLSRQLIRR